MPLFCTPEERMGKQGMKDEAVVEDVRRVRDRSPAQFDDDLHASWWTCPSARSNSTAG
jgi:hypothetical protein